LSVLDFFSIIGKVIAKKVILFMAHSVCMAYSYSYKVRHRFGRGWL